MRSAWNAADRRELEDRLRRLSPGEPARWGRMSALQMVAHLVDALHMALGDLPVEPKKLPIRFPPLKQLVLYVLPFPKGAPTAPELLMRRPEAWETELTRLQTLVDRFGAADRAATWPVHPAFGRLSGSAWGVLVYRHMDHHLRQFGV